MKNKKMKLIGVAILSLILVAVVAPEAFPATTATLRASVVSQQCRGGDGVSVTLTATLQPNRPGVMYQWDLNNDGVFDTPLSTDPTVTTVYGDELQVTATVRATKGTRNAENTVSFQTIRCP